MYMADRIWHADNLNVPKIFSKGLHTFYIFIEIQRNAIQIVFQKLCLRDCETIRNKRIKYTSNFHLKQFITNMLHDEYASSQLLFDS